MGTAASRPLQKPPKRAPKPSPEPGPGPELVAPPDRASVRRAQPSEWASTLQRVSGVISSSSWDDSAAPVLDTRHHAAKRSDESVKHLPSVRGVDQHLTLRKPDALTQNQIIALFNLRRKDPLLWDADAIAHRFRVQQEDVRDLLAFSRTYTGRLDPDGQVRAYYKVDVGNSVSRFEAD